MTLIVAIKCTDGVVVGADGAAPLGSLGQRTVRQPVKKLTILSNQIVVGVSGPVGLGQRITHKIGKAWDEKLLAGKQPAEAMSLLRIALWDDVHMELKVAAAATPAIGQQAALQSALASTVVALPIHKSHCFSVRSAGRA